jgi:SAM-dependent methyltransferase
MRCRGDWRPTKFHMIGGRLRGDQTGVYISVGSRVLGDLLASHYEAALKKYARGNMLDLGCGNAPLFGVYENLVDEVYCVDWLASLHQQLHVDVFADLTQPLPLCNDTFDTILLSDVLEHIPNPEHLISEISRLLRSSAHVVIGVPFLCWLHEIPHDFNRYTRYQLKRLLENAGLEVVQLTEVGGSPEVLVDIMSKTLLSRPRLAAAFVAVAKWVLKWRFVRRISQETRGTMPLAYVVVAAKPKDLRREANVLKEVVPG